MAKIVFFGLQLSAQHQKDVRLKTLDFNKTSTLSLKSQVLSLKSQLLSLKSSFEEMPLRAVATGFHEGDVFEENLILVVREGVSEAFCQFLDLL